MKATAPLRISFAGGGTDIEPFASQYGGRVLASAIKLYVTATHPSSREANQLEKIIGDELRTSPPAITNKLPSQSGLGGSATCFVAGIKSIRPEMGRGEIAQLAFHLERDVMGILTGKQDQWCAAFGGMLMLDFSEKHVTVTPITPPPSLESHLVLVYMGQRAYDGNNIHIIQMSSNDLSPFHEQKRIATRMYYALKNNDLKLFGLLLDTAWQTKRFFTPLITTKQIDNFYEKAKQFGAIGGKITGVGSGGFMLLMEHPDRRGELKANLKSAGIDYIDVKFDTEGVRLVD